MGEADKPDVSLPRNEAERKSFIRDHLLTRTADQIADARYTGEWGRYNRDPAKSSWKVRQANRYLTERDRRRALLWVTVGIWVGVVAVVVAILAMPVKDSLLCRLSGKYIPFCHGG
ncbi:hypothetical protein [Bradyrhizobium commune]|uniref:Uncharacterized protein n=1 Tax=Bradyrhizobium commune TaxID=83627 RepID=A0A7S9DA16_9BRAD|nr:hypothetical protein [Bradyrhizobium commune]QPF93753.1 hypothetical protein IC761_11005 [Bradyrhizobium commune]